MMSSSGSDLDSLSSDEAEDVIVNRPVVSTTLAFMNHGLNSGTVTNVRKIVVESFSLKELQRAHEQLFKLCQADLNCTRSMRRVKDTCVSDILSWMQELIKKDKMPYFVVDVAGIARLPKVHIEDVTEVAMCERMLRIEAHIKALDESLAVHSVNLSDINEWRSLSTDPVVPNPVNSLSNTPATGPIQKPVRVPTERAPRESSSSVSKSRDCDLRPTVPSNSVNNNVTVGEPSDEPSVSHDGDTISTREAGTGEKRDIGEPSVHTKKFWFWFNTQ